MKKDKIDSFLKDVKSLLWTIRMSVNTTTKEDFLLRMSAVDKVIKKFEEELGNDNAK